jgi:hypothetical protein
MAELSTQEQIARVEAALASIEFGGYPGYATLLDGCYALLAELKQCHLERDLARAGCDQARAQVQAIARLAVQCECHGDDDSAFYYVNMQGFDTYKSEEDAIAEIIRRAGAQI